MDKYKDVVLIEGMPGVGNVGKIAIDYLIEGVGAKKIYEIHNKAMPAYVHITEDGLLDRPKIEIYHKKIGGRDFIFLTSESQIVKDKDIYEFCKDLIVRISGLKEVVCLGGYGLDVWPVEPKVYVVGSTKKVLKGYKKWCVVGKSGEPIIGISGVLAAMAGEKGKDAVVLLGETFAETPGSLVSAKEVLKVVDAKFKFKIDLEDVDKEIKEVEEILSAGITSALDSYKKVKEEGAMNYIG